MTTQEALHKALKVLNCLNTDRPYETAWVKGAITACEEALQSQEQEARYLYVYARNGLIDYFYTEPKGWAEDFVGKIKLEVDDA